MTENQHKFAEIYDRLNNQPHIQELISTHVLELFYAEDREVWKTKNKQNYDLLIIEWNTFVECEIHQEDCTKEEAAANIIQYPWKPGRKISPLAYDLGIEYTDTINNLPDYDRKRTILELVELDRLHCQYY